METHLLVLLAGAATVALAMYVTAVAARRANRVAVVDVTWGLGFVAIAVVSALIGLLSDQGDPVRRWVLVALVSVWGGRLAWHIARRSRGHGEDPRYQTMLGGTFDEVGMGAVVRRVFAVQGVALWLISVPVMIGAVSDMDLWPAFVAGIVVWLIGVLFESVGDAQLAAYKADPDRAPVLDRGLWRYTRHPNYFGDAAVWWGLWLVGGMATAWWVGLITIFAPIAMTYFLLFATGARLLEQNMIKRPGYPEYVERTSMFFPLPPRKGCAG